MAALFIALNLLFVLVILLRQRRAATVELTDCKLTGTADACGVCLTQRTVCACVCVCICCKHGRTDQSSLPLGRG